MTMLPLPDSLSEEKVFQLGVEAYIYGYPLVLMNVTKDVSTAVPVPQSMKAPLNQFAHLLTFPDAASNIVSPNADTLYSIAWLDLSLDPIVLSVPDTQGRYYLMSVLDAWSNVFASLGQRTTGTKKGDFVIIGPNWMGVIPDELTVIQAPTTMVWIIGQTQTTGKADYAAVHTIQSRYRLTPLRLWGRPYNPPPDIPVNPMIDPRTPPVEQVNNMNAANFFGWMAALMKHNPPAVADTEIVRKFAAIGIIPGQDFEIRSLSEAGVRGLERSVKAAQEQISVAATHPKVLNKNHWLVANNLGSYGTNYLHRAGVAWIGLGATLPQDAIYPTTQVDGDGNPLNGNHRYMIHFDADQLPPVNAFWSITMYNSHQCFVDNPIDRYTISNRDPLVFNPDGSLDLYLQTTSPGAEQESNWLPSPSDVFNLIMRLYYPKPEVLDGNWFPPPIIRVS